MRAKLADASLEHFAQDRVSAERQAGNMTQTATLETVLQGLRFAQQRTLKQVRQGSNELDSSSSPARSSSVMLSVAKHLAADGDRPFASLRVTRCDCSSC